MEWSPSGDAERPNKSDEALKSTAPKDRESRRAMQCNAMKNDRDVSKRIEGPVAVVVVCLESTFDNATQRYSVVVPYTTRSRTLTFE